MHGLTAPPLADAWAALVRFDRARAGELLGRPAPLQPISCANPARSIFFPEVNSFSAGAILDDLL